MTRRFTNYIKENIEAILKEGNYDYETQNISKRNRPGYRLYQIYNGIEPVHAQNIDIQRVKAKI